MSELITSIDLGALDIAELDPREARYRLVELAHGGMVVWIFSPGSGRSDRVEGEELKRLISTCSRKLYEELSKKVALMIKDQRAFKTFTGAVQPGLAVGGLTDKFIEHIASALLNATPEEKQRAVSETITKVTNQLCRMVNDDHGN